MRIVGSSARLAVTLVALLVAISGCSKKGTEPTVDPGEAAVAEDMAQLGVAGMVFFGMDARTSAAFIPSSAPTSMALPAGFRGARPTRAMRDTSFVDGGYTYTASGDFANSGGLPVPYGPDAVALIWQTRSIVGTQVTPRDSVTLDFNDYDSVIEITGVQAGRDTLTFAGGSDDTLLHSFRSLDNSQTRHYHWGSAVTFQNIKIRKSALQGGIVTPLSGSIVFSINADRLNTRNRQDIVENDLQAIVRINFNGSTIVDLIVDSAFLFRWNMATGQIVRAS